MLIAISGSQGSGKSTLLKKIEEAGYPVIERKTSRSILTDWNVTLDQINRDPELCIKFQEEITRRKYEDERKAVLSDRLFFTERTYTDLFTYSLMNLGKFNQYHDWINQYYETCLVHNKTYSDIFYIPSGQFKIEVDGIRGSNPLYGTMIDITMKHYLEQMTPLTNEIKYINMSDINERFDFVIQSVKELIKHNQK